MVRDTITQIYKIKDKLSELRSSNLKKVCNICFEELCSDHLFGKCSVDDAIEALIWWQNILIGESDEVLVLGKDDEIIVPKFPNGNGVRNQSLKYDHMPTLAEKVFIYVGLETYFFNEWGEPVDSVEIPELKQGIYWGYIYQDKFYLLSTFNNGTWFNSRQGLTLARDIPLDAPITGFLHIPKGRLTHLEFKQGLVQT